MSESSNEQKKNVPHSVVFWLTSEIHELRPDGQCSGMPKERDIFAGTVKAENIEEAKSQRETIIQIVREELKRADQRERSI